VAKLREGVKFKKTEPPRASSARVLHERHRRLRSAEKTGEVGMKRNWLILGLVTLALAFPGAAYAGGDAAVGKAKAKSCAGCHGADGKGKKKNPPLTGFDEAAFAESMAAYKSGAKEHKMMNRLAKKLSDDDIANLAAYYATMK
jgi:cytochrome c553